VRLCEQTLSIIIPALRNVTDVDTLTSPALLSPRLAQRAYTIYAVGMCHVAPITKRTTDHAVMMMTVSDMITLCH
jgi:hypothetical protein